MAKRVHIEEETHVSKALVKKEAPGKLSLSAAEQEMAAEAKADAARFQQGVPRISFQGGVISIDKQKVKDNKLTVAIVEAVFGKAYYPGEFDPSTPQTPTCYAFHPTDQSAMSPHDAAPEKQAEKCLGCQWNRFGTADRGRGKRCKDEVRLMCTVGETDPESIAAGEFRMASIPPGSLKNWGNYLKKLRDSGTSVRGVMTEISLEAFQGAYKLDFKAVGKLEDASFFALKEKRESAVEEMMQPYPVLEVEAAPAPRKGVKSRKFE
jgi:hypothetical protein